MPGEWSERKLNPKGAGDQKSPAFGMATSGKHANCQLISIQNSESSAEEIHGTRTNTRLHE
jgi:hypothetical protein